MIGQLARLQGISAGSPSSARTSSTSRRRPTPRPPQQRPRSGSRRSRPGAARAHRGAHPHRGTDPDRGTDPHRGADADRPADGPGNTHAAPPPAAAAPAAHRRPPPPTGNAAAAIAFARAQLGEPYHYGAAGPNAWDCSGLTMMAWQAGGKSLPHYSVAQYQQSTPISLAQLQPGDLLFWGDGGPTSIYHAAIYTGDGMMIHAAPAGPCGRGGVHVLLDHPQLLRPPVGPGFSPQRVVAWSRDGCCATSSRPRFSLRRWLRRRCRRRGHRGRRAAV